MSEVEVVEVLREFTKQIRRLERRLAKMESQLERLGDAGEYFVHRARHNDELVAKDFARRQMTRDPFSD